MKGELKLGYFIKAEEIVHDYDEFFKLEDRARHPRNVFPKSSRQVDRPVTIGRGAQVNGSIYGKDVRVSSGYSSKKEDRTRTLSIFGREKVEIGDFCCIGGYATCAGEIEIGDYSIVKGDVIAHKIKKICQGTQIYGNLISYETLNIAENVNIGGYVIALNGEVAIEKNSKAYDLIASDGIKISDEVTILDPVVWSKGQIEFSSISVGDTFIGKSKMSNIDMQGEINPYATTSCIVNYNKLMQELKNNLQEK